MFCINWACAVELHFHKFGSEVTLYYVIDQSMINSCDIKIMFEGGANNNPLESTYIV
jgi:hypothetical protein